MNLKKVSLLFILLFVLADLAFAQSVTEGDAVRKVTEVYADTLKMDLYLPAGQPGIKRPVFLFVHGGGFSGGRRDLPSIEKYCRAIAAKGWVTASISYHLTRKGKGFNCNTPAAEKVETFLASAINVNQAVRFLLDQKSNLSIDPEKVVIAGSSAGAEAVLHAAYWEKSQVNILPEGFHYAGIVSMAGALTELSWITPSTVVPSLFFHGTCDNLVPYKYASHHYCDSKKPGYLPLYGPVDIVNQMKKYHSSWYFVSDCGGDHGWSGKPLDEVNLVHSMAFLEKIQKGQRMAERVRLDEGTKECPQYSVSCETDEEEGALPILLIFAGIITGIINTLAGSGTLISIGILIMMGYPAVLANTSNRPGVLVQNISGLLTMRWFGKLKFKMDYPILFAILAGSLIGSFLAVKIPNAGMEWIAVGLMAFILLSRVVDLKKNFNGFFQKDLNLVPSNDFLFFYQ